MSLDYSVIGGRLKEARIKKNLTQEKLAEEIDVSVAFLSRVECGSTKISLSRLVEICEKLEITNGSILDGTSKTSSTYLNKEFSDLIKNCSPENLKMIYDNAKIVVNKK